MTSLWLDRRQDIHTDSFEPNAHYDAVVVGAGLTGATTALLLARGGMRVIVIEARGIGSVTTGHTTGKLSLLQGTVLSGIRHHTSERTLKAYVDGNREGQAWLLRYLAEHGIPFQTRDAYTYAATQEGTQLIERELEASRQAELDVTRHDDLDLPFETHGALLLSDQAQVNPMDVLEALVDEFRTLGGTICEHVRMTGADAGDPVNVSTSKGPVSADHVILATGTPVLDRGLYFAKVEPLRSYAAAYRVPGSVEGLPRGMYLSADDPTRSLRTAPVDGETLLLSGGNGHPVGREASPRRKVEELEAWTTENFPGAQRTHRWSAQDYRSANMVPFVGWLPRGRGRIYLATGYNKWGMTNAIAAALSLTADLLGGHLPWAQTLHHRITGPADIATGAKINSAVAGRLASGWVEAEISGPDLSAEAVRAAPPDDGHGIVGHRDGRPVGVSTVNGTTCAVSAVCSHLGGIVTWNDAEQSWDCPLHGSRFTASGEVLEGPATTDLHTMAMGDATE